MFKQHKRHSELTRLPDCDFNSKRLQCYSAKLLIGLQKVFLLYTVNNCDGSNGTFNVK